MAKLNRTRKASPAPKKAGKIKVTKGLTKASSKSVPSKPLSPTTFVILVLGFLLTALVFLQSASFKWLGVPFYLPPEHLNFLMVLGFGLMAYGFYISPSQPAVSDWPRRVVYPLLVLILALAAFFRYYRIDQAVSCYWDDIAICIIDPRNVFDLKIHPMTFPIGHREPLYPYVAAGVWWLFPWLKAVFVQRLTDGFFDVAAVYLFYLLGKEVSGKRRVGILLAALGAVSKPMILQNLCAMGGLTLTLGISLLLLFQVKIFKKPALSNFLCWGLVMAFGVYTYITIRPWMLYLAIMTLAWILWSKREQPVRILLWVLLALFGVGYFLFFLDKMLFVFHDNSISKFWGGSAALFILLQALFLSALIYFYRTSREEGKERELTCWALGLLLAGVLIYPLAQDPFVSVKIGNLSLLPKNPSQWLDPAFIKTVQDGLASSLKAIFFTGEDRTDMNVIGDPFFDYHAAVLAVLGLAFALARPSWWKAFFLLCAFVGIVPRFLTSDPQSAKLLGSMPPLLLLASLGLNHWLESSWKVPGKSRWMGILLAVGLACFWGWEIQGTFQRVYGKWWDYTGPDVIVSREVSKDLPEKRVYVAAFPGMGFFSPAVLSVLHDGDPVYLMDNTNVIDVPPQEARKDLAVYVFAGHKDLVSRLKKEFPGSEWTPEFRNAEEKAANAALFYHVTIPASQIPEKPGKSFMYRVVDGKNWLRRVYETQYGLGRGIIRYEDLSPALNPLPNQAGAHSLAAEKEWEAPSDGHYQFSVRGQEITQLWIDGKLILDFKPGMHSPISNTVFLKQGSHQVRYITYLQTSLFFPPVTIRNQDSNYAYTLDGPA